MKEMMIELGIDLKAVLLGLTLCQLSVHASYGQTPTQMTPKQADSLYKTFTAKGAVYVDHTGERFLSGNIFVPDNNYRLVTIQLRNAEGAEIQKMIPDDKGNFKVVLDWAKKPVSIFVTAYGYQPELVFLNNLSSLQSVKISLVKTKNHASTEQILQKE